MNKDTAICYVADNRYLIPTLIASEKIKKYVKNSQSTIFIFLIDRKDNQLDIIKDFKKSHKDIIFIDLDSKIYSK